jgi:hypothetical protein
LVVRACIAASLNEEEPTIEAAPPVEAEADADADADVAEADAEALLLVAAGAVVLLLDELEQAVRASSAPAPTPIAVANFLCTDNLLVAVWNCKRHGEITNWRCERSHCCDHKKQLPFGSDDVNGHM